MQADERMLLACLALVLCIPEGPEVHYENKVNCAFLSWAEATFVSTSLCVVAVASGTVIITNIHDFGWSVCRTQIFILPGCLPGSVVPACLCPWHGKRARTPGPFIRRPKPRTGFRSLCLRKPFKAIALALQRVLRLCQVELQIVDAKPTETIQHRCIEAMQHSSVFVAFGFF